MMMRFKLNSDNIKLINRRISNPISLLNIMATQLYSTVKLLCVIMFFPLILISLIVILNNESGPPFNTIWGSRIVVATIIPPLAGLKYSKASSIFSPLLTPTLLQPQLCCLKFSIFFKPLLRYLRNSYLNNQWHQDHIQMHQRIQLPNCLIQPLNLELMQNWDL